MSEQKWYVELGVVRGGFYDEMGGMLVGERAQDICDRLNSLADIQAELERLRDPDWETYIALTKKWLEHYPPDIFTGVSGDPGPLFVVAVRKAIRALLEKGEQE